MFPLSRKISNKTLMIWISFLIRCRISEVYMFAKITHEKWRVGVELKLLFIKIFFSLENFGSTWGRKCRNELVIKKDAWSWNRKHIHLIWKLEHGERKMWTLQSVLIYQCVATYIIIYSGVVGGFSTWGKTMKMWQGIEINAKFSVSLCLSLISVTRLPVLIW